MSGTRRLALALIVLAALHLLTLRRYPAVFTDEAWFAARAIAYADTGCAFGPLDRGVFERFPGHCSVFPVLPVWFQSLGIRVTGDPLLGVRAVSLLAGVALLAALASVARRLAGEGAGVAVVLVTGTSQAFLVSSHLGRYDVLCAALGWSAVALALRGGGAAAFLAGLAAGLSLECHAYGAIYPAVVALAFALAHGWRRLLSASGLPIAAGLLAALGCYLLVHVFPDPRSYFEFQRLAFSSTHLPPLASGDLLVVLRGLLRPFESLFWSYAILTPLIGAGAFFAWRGAPGGRRLLAVSAGTLLCAGMLIPNKLWYYRILFSPALDLLAAQGLASIFGGFARSGAASTFARRTAAALCAAAVAFAWTPAIASGAQLFRDVGARLAASAKPGERVMGAQLYWLELRDRDYFSWEQLVYYRRAVPGKSLADALQAFRPDVLILDAQLASFVLDAWETDDPYTLELRIPRRELQAFLALRGRAVDDFAGLYGRTTVYRLDWSRERPPTTQHGNAVQRQLVP
jgi:4-amino-4-deoxy-L-arabinose transferase-like glycosyltransferase